MRKEAELEEIKKTKEKRRELVKKTTRLIMSDRFPKKRSIRIDPETGEEIVIQTLDFRSIAGIDFYRKMHKNEI